MATIEEKDMEIYLDFQAQWYAGTLTNDHPVVVITNKWATTLSWRYGCPDRADDFTQEALLRLATSSFSGKNEARLSTYILSVVQRLNIADWRRNGGHKRCEMPTVDQEDRFSLDFFEKVVQRLSENKLMADLLATRSDVKRMVIMIIVQTERQVGRRRLAEIASQKLGRNVTRHEVEAILAQLREVVQRPSGYHKAKAG